jgi:hypothetical protein
MENTKALIRLFKAVSIDAPHYEVFKPNLMEKTLPYGFILAPEVANNYLEPQLDQLIRLIIQEIGLSADQMNQTFHKSWQKIQDAPIIQLVLEQIMHYFTTYGFEQIGCFSHTTVYIPPEKLEIPKLETEGLTLIVIRGYTSSELKTKLIQLLASGIALDSTTIQDVVTIATYLNIDETVIESIKNKEVRVALYSYLDLIPEKPIEFLRFLVYKATKKTLLIKDKTTIATIKTGVTAEILALMDKYKELYGLQRLATIFYRFKPLFLAFRGPTGLNEHINKIRKLATKYHIPMQEDYLNQVTAKIKRNNPINVDTLKAELSKVNTFRKIRLAYALKFRGSDPKSILYRIRNGKGYATTLEVTNQPQMLVLLEVVLDAITNDLANQVKDKRIYIPENIIYMLPTTEKQFTGNLPSGSYITLSKDMIVGIHWENLSDKSVKEEDIYDEDNDGSRIDLDLAMVNAEIKLGWDGLYRSNTQSILFSGDMTDAPKPFGASELFYIKMRTPGAYVLTVNYYNYSKEISVPFSIVVAQNHLVNFPTNYMLNPNKIKCQAQSTINQKQKILGILVISPMEIRFYFAETYIGKTISSKGTKFIRQSLDYLLNFYTNAISLNALLERAGATIVQTKKDCDINLAPTALEKDTILRLFYNKN